MFEFSAFQIAITAHIINYSFKYFSRDSVRGQMPSRQLGDVAKQKHLMYALDSEISRIKQKWIGYVNVAITLYYERVQKAVSLDEYTECQDILAREVTKVLEDKTFVPYIFLNFPLFR